MYCVKCGTKIEETLTACQNCGEPKMVALPKYLALIQDCVTTIQQTLARKPANAAAVAYNSKAPVGIVLCLLYLAIFTVLYREALNNVVGEITGLFVDTEMFLFPVIGGLVGGTVGLFIDTAEILWFSVISEIIWIGGIFGCMVLLCKLFKAEISLKAIFNILGAATVLASLILLIAVVVTMFSPIAGFLLSSSTAVVTCLILCLGICHPEIRKAGKIPILAYLPVVVIFNVVHFMVWYNMLQDILGENFGIIGEVLGRFF
ncbi:MAG: hypothetical protein FWG64_08290 [Firmicutes bacterium]|nr:hypothetical protein [Bacillota bacterium]